MPRVNALGSNIGGGEFLGGLQPNLSTPMSCSFPSTIIRGIYRPGAQPGGGAQGARAPPLSCRAVTSYERRPATRVVF